MPSIFSQIIAGEIPCRKEYEDEDCIVIHDIHPQAKTHLLIIPKKEIPTLNDITSEDTQLIGHLFQVAKQVARQKGIEEGYQLKLHVGAKGGQEVFHIHFHLTSDL